LPETCSKRSFDQTTQQENVSREEPGNHRNEENKIEHNRLPENVSANFPDIQDGVTDVGSDKYERTVILEVSEVAEQNSHHSSNVVNKKFPEILLISHRQNVIKST
jgi:hypothetical protein